MERQGAFDYILLETTGLADPGNIAPIFWVDDGLGSSIYLDGIVTVVDAVNVVKCLEEPVTEERVEEQEGKAAGKKLGKGLVLTTAHLQISHADILLLNKSDLVSTTELESIKARIQAINGLAKIIPTTHSRVPQLEGILLDLHAYDSHNVSTIPSFQAKGHSHLDASISTRSFTLPYLTTNALASLDAWLREVLWREGKEEDKEKGVGDTTNDNNHDDDGAVAEVHRVKGILPLVDGSIKILQGVREIFEITHCSHTVSAEVVEEGGKIVMIGRRLDSIDTPSIQVE
jgi:G3E family GTPase